MNVKDKIIIFTDGASRGNPGPGGWGAIVVQEKNVVELGGAEKNTTNNRMELTAAIEALSFLSKVKGQMSIVIYTDSSYLINGITKWIYSWERRNWITKNKEPVLNKDLWEKLLELSKNKKIEWKNISGHSGVIGNERADKIATSFADGENAKLFSGPFSKYEIKILDLNENQASKKSSKNSRGKAFSYLSLVDGIAKKHKTWEECEKRVRGKSGAKFKKAMSESEEKEILKSWANK